VTSDVNPCVYHNQGAMKTICAIFVDDGILCAVNEQKAHSIFNHSHLKINRLLCWTSNQY